MSTTEQVATHSIDSIIDQLDRYRQRATYGAVAAVLNRREIVGVEFGEERIGDS